MKKITLPAEAAREVAKQYGEEFVAAVEAAIAGGLDALTIYAEQNEQGMWDVGIKEPSGIMVALFIPSWAQNQVAVPGGEPKEDLHITLNYLGDAAEMSLNEQRRLIGVVGEVARRTRCLEGELVGTGRFTNGEETDPFWVGVQVPGLMDLQEDLANSLKDAGFSPHADYGDYRPHVTVAYIPAEAETPALEFAPVKVCFEHLTVAIGGQRLELGLVPKGDMWPEEQPSGWVPEAIAKAVDVVEEERYTLGPWYVPDQLDAHNEYTDVRELQKSFHGYLAKEDRDIRLQHNIDVVAGRWVDGMVMPIPFTTKLTKADGSTQEFTYPAGTPFLGVRWEPWAWELVKAGKIRGYSIGGSSERIEVDLH
jgi:2'-5' RNA ligase